MGVKYEGGDVFDATMKGLMAVPGVTPEMVYETARPLIRALLDLSWDNSHSTLGEWEEESPAVVAAFKDNSIFLTCGVEHATEPWQCEEEKGHPPGTPHIEGKGYTDRTWTEEESAK